MALGPAPVQSGELPNQEATMVTPNINSHAFAIGIDGKLYVKCFSGGVRNGFVLSMTAYPMEARRGA